METMKSFYGTATKTDSKFSSTPENVRRMKDIEIGNKIRSFNDELLKDGFCISCKDDSYKLLDKKLNYAVHTFSSKDEILKHSLLEMKLLCRSYTNSSRFHEAFDSGIGTIIAFTKKMFGYNLSLKGKDTLVLEKGGNNLSIHFSLDDLTNINDLKFMIGDTIKRC